KQLTGQAGEIRGISDKGWKGDNKGMLTAGRNWISATTRCCGVRRLRIALIACFFLATSAFFPAPPPRDEKIKILIGEYGVPHIFAPTAAAAAFGSGYAQAEDRLEELLRNYRRAEGTMAEAFGEEYVSQDYWQRVWRHREVAQQHYKDLDPQLRAVCE